MNSKSIKYLLFGIGMMLLAILSNGFFKGDGGGGASPVLILMQVVIPYAAMIVGFIALIKGMLTKE